MSQTKTKSPNSQKSQKQSFKSHIGVGIQNAVREGLLKTPSDCVQNPKIVKKAKTT